jgi:hypothetical protein
MHIRARICPYLDLNPTSHPAGGVMVFQKALGFLLDDLKTFYESPSPT